MSTRPTLRPPRSAAFGLLFVAGVSLAACSGDDAATRATSATGTPTVVSQTTAVDSSTSIAAPPTTLPLGDPSTEVTDPVDVGTAPTPGSDMSASSLTPGAESTVPVATGVPLPSVPIDATVTTRLLTRPSVNFGQLRKRSV